MKNNIYIYFLILILYGCQGSLEKYEISNAIQISIPSELELRNENSIFNQTMDGIRDEYNPNHAIKIGKSKLIFQPKGTDNLEKDAVEDVTRILVKYFKIGSNSFPKWNFKISNQELIEINKQIKIQTISELKTMPFEYEITEWSPLKMGSINGLSYIKGTYLSLVNNETSYTETYQFFNKNEKVIISNTTNFSDKEKWVDVFNDVIKTFKFKNKK